MLVYKTRPEMSYRLQIDPPLKIEKKKLVFGRLFVEFQILCKICIEILMQHLGASIKYVDRILNIFYLTFPFVDKSTKLTFVVPLTFVRPPPFSRIVYVGYGCPLDQK